MIKRVCKNLVFMLVFFALGFALFLPGQSKIETSAETVSQEATETVSTIDEKQLNSDGTINIQSVTSSDIEWVQLDSISYPATQTVRAYAIKTVAGLASVAYHVNNGDVDSATGQAYASATYVLCSGMDLSGLIWTPIGTQENPFTGIFWGGGWSVSNIQLDSNFSDSYRGFFGYVNGGKIAELIIQGNFS